MSSFVQRLGPLIILMIFFWLIIMTISVLSLYYLVEYNGKTGILSLFIGAGKVIIAVFLSSLALFGWYRLTRIYLRFRIQKLQE